MRTSCTPACVDRLDLRLVEQRALLDDDLAGRRIAHVLGRGAAEDADAERGHDRAGVDDRAHLDAGLGAAVVVVMMQSCATSTRRRVR